MEELWKSTHQSSFQDFLARAPISLSMNDPKDHKARHDDDDDDDDVVDDNNDDGDGHEKIGMFKKEFLTTSGFMSSLNSPFEALATVAASSSAVSLLNTGTCFPITKKRLSDDQTVFDAELGGNPRHKRMMKNRESAARSRARRQAYTTQLEREHAELKEENAKLRKQQELVNTDQYLYPVYWYLLQLMCRKSAPVVDHVQHHFE
ncbi:protein FD isoform X1 [Beta vulgaris subsp. vulgaris]|uniref:protein FD isoform X1 n=1 Tax=Beta vulgaris subsp. vulgaris TaxID=3555 RepID=UPI002036A0C8|nr:protein FD isoform X1 [Beta vulgaris subsp. vulgaris]